MLWQLHFDICNTPCKEGLHFNNIKLNILKKLEEAILALIQKAFDKEIQFRSDALLMGL